MSNKEDLEETEYDRGYIDGKSDVLRDFSCHSDCINDCCNMCCRWDKLADMYERG